MQRVQIPARRTVQRALLRRRGVRAHGIGFLVGGDLVAFGADAAVFGRAGSAFTGDFENERRPLLRADLGAGGGLGGNDLDGEEHAAAAGGDVDDAGGGGDGAGGGVGTVQLEEVLAVDVVVGEELGKEGVHGRVDLGHGLDGEDGGEGGEGLELGVEFVDGGEVCARGAKGEVVADYLVGGEGVCWSGPLMGEDGGRVQGGRGGGAGRHGEMAC